MTTISINKTAGVVLNPASYANPVVIEAGVTISNSSGDAVSDLPYPAFFIIQNNGRIFGNSVSRFGVNLTGGGSVANAASASIKGYGSGIQIFGGAGTVVNDGSIASLEEQGVYLTDGGSVSNGAAGSITGNTDGVNIISFGTVVNDGRSAAGAASI
jgi:hypothetical protein